MQWLSLLVGVRMAWGCRRIGRSRASGRAAVWGLSRDASSRATRVLKDLAEYTGAAENPNHGGVHVSKSLTMLAAQLPSPRSTPVRPTA